MISMRYHKQSPLSASQDYHSLFMRYLINHSIIYDAKAKTLSHRDDADNKISITPGSVAILLDFFISYPDQIWTKAELGQRALDHSPYSGSEANVNKSLSLLRRYLSDLGAEREVLATVPHQGIIFSAAVTEYPASATESLASAKRTPAPHRRRFLLPASILLLIIITAVTASFLTARPGCITIERGDRDSLSGLREKLDDFALCQRPAVTIDGIRDSKLSGQRYSMIAVCPQDDRQCINYIEK